MTEATKTLINELSEITDSGKYLIISGGSAVGKTFLATKVAENCSSSIYNAQGKLNTPDEKYEVHIELIPIHSSYSYDDFVSGVFFSSKDGNAEFDYKDKIFLSMLKKANLSWENDLNRKYFLILDDIGRGMISGILGDMLPLIEPHGNQRFSVSAGMGIRLQIPPNFYIIATQNTLIDSVEPTSFGLMRHFYHRIIDTDYRYMSDDASEVYSAYDVYANAMYNQSKKLLLDNLKYRNQLSAQEKEKYIIGHGVFKDTAISLVMRCQVLPILRQYIKENILDKSALVSINRLEKMIAGEYSKDKSVTDFRSISEYRTDVDKEVFYDENTTHRPIVNLVSRIKAQGLMSDTDIADLILFNKGVLLRRTDSSEAYLYAKKTERGLYTYGPSQRNFYSSGGRNNIDILKVNGTEFVSAAEMQPKEYTRWSDILNSDTFINERGSSSPNSIIFRILRSYYNCLTHHYNVYLHEFPDDENIVKLKSLAKAEFSKLITDIKQIGKGPDDADVNLERNRRFRELVSNLKLLWTDAGATISWNGETVIVEGVYKMIKANSYKDFSNAMENLGIRQMIIQGPPGTSKTYSAREYLKFIGQGTENDDFLTDEQLDSMQVKNYTENASLSAWVEDNNGMPPPLAWDIVQFHPSYGYEDFVRGIEVSTVKTKGESRSGISYDTVDKVLGKMADLANRPCFATTKFILVIDEINRANLATVFGELIYGLEYRERSVATPYTVKGSNKLSLPGNLYVIGTMNTADKSIGGIDYAIRRRFLFFSLLPDRGIITDFNISTTQSETEKRAQLECNEKAAKLYDIVEKLFDQNNLNAEYYRDDVQIGHTYFLVDSEEKLFMRFKYQILPILKEYYKDGLFQFSQHEVSDDFNAFIACITGDVNLYYDDDRLREIFTNLLLDN